MNESVDRFLDDWLREGPEIGPRDGLERALAETRRVGQRPGWTLPERWLPMDLTMTRTSSQQPILAMVMLALLLVALSAAALFIGSQLRQSSPFRNGAIVYEQAGDLFIADELGGTPRLLVAGPQTDSDPIFSPQGDRIAFVRSVARILTVRPDGTGVTELASDPDWSLNDVRLDWAPDGGALLVSLDRSWGSDPNDWRLYVVASDGSGPPRTIEAGPDTPGGAASWRPDGRQIAFLGAAEGRYAAFVADADGTNVRRLQIDLETAPDDLGWSPDGTRLSLTTHSGGRSQVTIADIDADGTVTGSHQLLLDPGLGVESAAMWSPDGRHLALRLSHGSKLQFGILEADGSGYRIVGPPVSSVWDSDLTWAPDGRSLAVMGHVLQVDPVTQISGFVEKAWSVDIATGEQTELETPVASWQRLAP